MPETGQVLIKFKLNGKSTEALVAPTLTLLEMLRRNYSLNAAKEGCGKGECGACTILLNNKPVNSCLKFAATLLPTDEVTTLEGLDGLPLLAKIQQAYVDEGAVQCGFCIPGMVISTYHLLANEKSPSDRRIKEALSGNICRCTGYKKIIAAVKCAGREKEGKK